MQHGEPQAIQRKRRSVRFKINLAIAGIVLFVVALLMAYSYVADREANLQLAIAQAKGMNGLYFDSLNTLMIADGIEEREVLRSKMLQIPGIVEVRISRGEAINKKFGQGLPGEQAVDDLDRRGLGGESVVHVGEIDGQRVVTVVQPYRLTEDTRGTDCLECHRRVEPGTVGGAVRISYSLKDTDSIALAGLWQKMGVIATLLVFGMGALTLVMNRLVVRPIGKMVERVKDIAAGDGDLTQMLDEKSNDELGELAHWFNAFVGKLRHMIDEIRTHVDELTEASGHMMHVTEQTGDSVFQQRAETDQVASAMTEMTSTVAEVARHAGEAAAAAARSNDEARQGKAVMNVTIGAINALASEVDNAGAVIQRLEKESNDISMVLDVIRGIAEQTNLLALNAAIEAARAGEQGRGFAVVADEVRTLAERTQKSTAEIQQMIESLQTGAKGAVEVMNRGRQQAGNSVDQAARAGASLDAISDAVDTISEMSTQIAHAADQHSKVSGEINRNVININEAANRTASDTTQVATACQQLSKVAEDLRRLVKQFKIS